jgi:hypothetical protein
MGSNHHCRHLLPLPAWPPAAVSHHEPPSLAGTSLPTASNQHQTLQQLIGFQNHQTTPVERGSGITNSDPYLFSSEQRPEWPEVASPPLPEYGSGPPAFLSWSQDTIATTCRVADPSKKKNKQCRRRNKGERERERERETETVAPPPPAEP